MQIALQWDCERSISTRFFVGAFRLANMGKARASPMQRAAAHTNPRDSHCALTLETRPFYLEQLYVSLLTHPTRQPR